MKYYRIQLCLEVIGINLLWWLFSFSKRHKQLKAACFNHTCSTLYKEFIVHMILSCIMFCIHQHICTFKEFFYPFFALFPFWSLTVFLLPLISEILQRSKGEQWVVILIKKSFPRGWCLATRFIHCDLKRSAVIESAFFSMRQSPSLAAVSTSDHLECKGF